MKLSSSFCMILFLARGLSGPARRSASFSSSSSPFLVAAAWTPVHSSSSFHRRSTRLASSATSTSSGVMGETSWPADLPLIYGEGLVQTAEAAARAAGEIIRTNLGCSSQLADTTAMKEAKIKTSIKDIVTQYDSQAQQAVESIIRGAYPGHSFLGEEDVDPGALASENALNAALQQQDAHGDDEKNFLWICDPIDGTANFAAGLPLCGVTLAVVYKGTAIMGMIYDPHADELFYALKGQGAFSKRPNEPLERMQVSQAVVQVQDAIVNAGCPADAAAFATSLRGIAAMNGACRGVRMIACSCFTTAWIAAGRLTAHFGYDLSSWDLVAGALLIQEAGGMITDLDGTPYQLTTRSMLCSNKPSVHDEILRILTEADAVSFTRSG